MSSEHDRTAMAFCKSPPQEQAKLPSSLDWGGARASTSRWGAIDSWLFWERERDSMFFKAVTTDRSTRFQWMIPSNWTSQLYIWLYMHVCTCMSFSKSYYRCHNREVKVTIVTDSLLTFWSLPYCLDSFTDFLWSYFQETHYHPTYLFRFCIHDSQTGIFAGKIIRSTEQDKNI